MICPYCKEEIADGAIKCKHCNSMLNTSCSVVPPTSDVHVQIDLLPISDGLKQALHLVHDNIKGVKLGFPDYGKTTGSWKLFSFWAFFFNCIYYFVKGMWRKGLLLLLLNIILGAAIGLFAPKFLGAQAFVSAAICMQCAYHDLYRKLIKKETFWW